MQLEPSRDLDVLIAERVMGYKRAHMDDPEINFAGDIWLHPNGAKYSAALPEYSTSIEAAWEVVEKLFSKSILLSICHLVDSKKGSWEYLVKAVGFTKHNITLRLL